MQLAKAQQLTHLCPVNSYRVFFTNSLITRNFRFTAYGCYQLTDESPYSILNGTKIHLYERKDWPDYFVSPIHYAGCFNTNSLDDADAIHEAGWFY